MRSDGNADLDGFLDATPVTKADVEALEQICAHDGPVEYLQFLEAFAARHPPTREVPESNESFRL